MQILVAIVSLAIAVFAFIGYTSPAYDEIKSTKSDITRFDSALEKARELQELRRALLARYNTFSSSDLERLRKFLPDHVDNVRLVLDLDNMALTHGMAIQNVVISRGDDKEEKTTLGAISSSNSPVDSLILQFATQARYDDLVAFLKDLESSLRIVDLVSLRIEPAQSVPETVSGPLYSINMSIRTYWLK